MSSTFVGGNVKSQQNSQNKKEGHTVYQRGFLFSYSLLGIVGVIRILPAISPVSLVPSTFIFFPLRTENTLAISSFRSCRNSQGAFWLLKSGPSSALLFYFFVPSHLKIQ